VHAGINLGRRLWKKVSLEIKVGAYHSAVALTSGTRNVGAIELQTGIGTSGKGYSTAKAEDIDRQISFNGSLVHD